MSNVNRFLSRALRSPWIVTAILTVLGTISVWLALGAVDHSNYKKVVVGAGFGFAIGLIYLIEVRLATRPLVHRTLGAIVGAGYAACVIVLLGSLTFGQALLTTVVSIVLGATARDWMGHITFV
jgi:hypothetical protein